MSPHITRFVRTVVQLAKESSVARSRSAFEPGEGGFATWMMLAINCYREREDETYRSVVDKLEAFSELRDPLDLSLEDLPNPSTVCKAFDDLTAAICRRLLEETLDLFDLGETAAIDASSFDRVAASRRYAQRTEYRFLAMKTTVLTDCETGAILDVHCTTSRPHDTQIGWQVLTRNIDRMEVLMADKGYDWSDLRTELRAHDIRPVIKHREFDSLDKAHNARIDDEVYHQRSMAESSFAVLKQRYNDRLTTRIWYQQFREVILKAVVKNIDKAIGASHH